MRLLTIRTEAGLKLGVSTSKGVLDVTCSNEFTADQIIPQTIEQVIAGGNESLSALTHFVNQAVNSTNGHLFLKEEEVTFGPSVPNPGKIICIGLNYRKHAEESNMPIPQYPIVFNKFNNSIAATGDIITLPSNSEQVDYEAELVIVIGKTAKHVSKEDALDHVFGYCNGNDFTARDLQFRTNQWLLGKSCDGFSPLGPILVTSDEVGNPNNLAIRSFVNGDLRQDSNTEDMVFRCDELVSYLSQYMTLEPGDIIFTGTPEGVIMGFPKEKQKWLKNDDEVRIEIDKLGVLINRMRREK